MKTGDGGFLLEGRFTFKTLTSYQAEEMAEVILRRSREALTLGLNVSFKAYDLAIGDIVNVAWLKRVSHLRHLELWELHLMKILQLVYH